MVKIMYITDQIYLHGGGERVLTNKSNYFVENKIAEVYIVTSEQKGKPPCYAINDKVVFKDLNINYNRVLSYFSFNNFSKILKHFIKLKRIINEVNPDVIVTLSTQFDYYFLPFICPKIPKIKEFHSSGFFNNLNRKNNTSFIKKQFYKLNDYIESSYEAVALLTKDEEQYYNSKKKIVIPNALSFYPPETSELKNKIAISAGRIVPVKQFDKLIKAWSYVHKENPYWKLKIYGDGDYENVSKLKEIIDQLELNEAVELCGSSNQLENAMLNASLYLMSSETECFPMVLLEAMGCGLPIVSFDCPHGPKNIVQNDVDGYLVEANNEKKLAEAILSIISNKNQLKSKGALARLNARRFLDTEVMPQWVKLFTTLIKK